MLFRGLAPPGVAIHGDCLAIAQTIVNHSPKLGWFAGFLAKCCIRNRHKVLIICHWPLTEQQIEAILTNLVFNVLSI